jgi:hypothetical protein
MLFGNEGDGLVTLAAPGPRGTGAEEDRQQAAEEHTATETINVHEKSPR